MYSYDCCIMIDQSVDVCLYASVGEPSSTNTPIKHDK